MMGTQPSIAARRPLHLSRDALATGALFLALAVLYGSLPSERYDLDTLPELARLERGALIDGDPAHGFYVPLGWAVWRAARIFDPGIPARDALLMANALLGAAAIAAFAAVLRRSAVDPRTTLFLAFAAAVSYGFWSHASDAFFIIPAAAAAVVAWWAALGARTSVSRRSAWLLAAGVAFGLAMLLHQANILLAPALLMASHRPGAPVRGTLRAAVLPACVALLVALPFWWVQAGQVGTAPSEWFGWFVGAHGGMDRGLWRRDGVAVVPVTLVAWLATVVPVYEGMRIRLLLDGVLSPRHLPAQIALAAFGLVVAGALAGGALRWQRGARSLDAPLAAALLWFLVPATAVVWFDRAEVKLWLIPFFGAWVLLARGLDALAAEATGFVARMARAAPVVLSAALFLGNFLVFALPAHSGPWPERAKALDAAMRLRPGDVVVSASFDWTGHLAYTCPTCRVLSLVHVAQSGQSVDGALERARAEALDAGGTVYLAGPLGDPGSPEWQSGIARFTGLSPDDLAELAPSVAWRFDDGEIVWAAAERSRR